MATPPDINLPTSRPRAGYVKNVLWTWFGVVLTLITGFFLSPYVIRKLGPSAYGVWVLLSSLIGYYGILELGARSALVRYSAYYHARGEFEQVNELINTTIGYYTAISSVLLLVAVVLSRFSGVLFQVPPEHKTEFTALIFIGALSAIVGVNVFAATLEGLQAFDIGTKVYLVTLALRTVGTYFLIYMGYGLIALALNVFAIQVIGYVLGYLAFRKVFPALRLGPRFVKFSVLRHMASYAVHTFLANIATQLLSQTPALLIGVFRPAAYIGYYSFPVRMMEYGLDFVMRVGLVSSSRAAELSGKGLLHEVFVLAEDANRYCLTLFLPLSLFLLPYGHRLISVWINPEFASYSAPILPIVVLSATLAYSAQFSSSAILFGIGKHKGYSQGLWVEAALNVTGMFILIPRFGIMGAAWAAAIPMIAVRGIYTPALLCRNTGGGFVEFMRSIFVAPLLSALPAIALGFYLRERFLPGNTWPQLIAAGLLVAFTYWGIALLTCVKPEHRSALMARARGILPFMPA